MPVPVPLPPLLPLPASLRLLRRWEFPRKLGLCERWFAAKLAAGGVTWVRTAPGPVWKLDLANPTHRWIVYGFYEGPALWRWLTRHAATVRTIVDSGANIGQAVLYFATITPAARVLAYEPGAAARAWLQEGVAANGFDRVSISPLGLGAAPARARLRDDGAAAHHGAWNKVSETVGEPIELTTLDDELERHGIAALDLWKLDMEGYEGFALRGAARSLEAHRIRAIYIETAGDSGRDNLAFLTARGYTPHGIAPNGRLLPWNQSHEYECALCLAPGREAR